MSLVLPEEPCTVAEAWATFKRLWPVMERRDALRALARMLRYRAAWRWQRLVEALSFMLKELQRLDGRVIDRAVLALVQAVVALVVAALWLLAFEKVGLF